MKKVLFIIIGLSFLFSCRLQKGYLMFSGKQDEIIATKAIKDFMKNNNNPSIVLKVPYSEGRVTQADPNSYIYNTIEKELLLAGFDVKDRGLFNEVISRSKDVGYDEIKKLTGTDLILELVNISTDVKYNTNKYYRIDGEEKIVDYNFVRLGARIEFKLTLIENNQFAGSYSFNYTPCSSITPDCNCTVLYKTFPNKIYTYINPCNFDRITSQEPFEFVSQDAMIDFVKNGIRKMITEIRQ